MSSKYGRRTQTACLTPRRAVAPIRGMSKDAISRPKSPRQLAADNRREREAEALRANLRKRKEQQRSREVPPSGEKPAGLPEPLPDDQPTR
jgi:hypothetical protein